MYDPSNPAQTQAVQDCVKKMVRRAIEMEGTVSVMLSTKYPWHRALADQV
jgi:D-lactate dehydrogenase (cytochrome)